ncbi:MAG TPA: hypothetical protein VM661_06690 [Candidatus Sulfotelmatobacter sp.]|jgi:hypothetical protein|nr:hypothetical protein [Candidatus Sulfotelmatobacter sp.]
MTSLTQRYSEMSGQSRSLENQARRLTNDATRLRTAISEMNEALDHFSANGPVVRLRRAAEEIRQGGSRIPTTMYEYPAMLMAAE